ncbi:MAG: ion transporter, partial [Spirochaetales bacterium]|nr:ion transporter [Spirochaetales bacterium]
MIRPDSTFKNSWDSYVLLVSLFASIVYPLSMVFELRGFLSSFVLYSLVNLVFVLDMVMYFRTGFINRGKLDNNPKTAGKRYLKGWFSLDLVAALPLWLLAFLIPGAAALKILRLNVLVKLLKGNRTFRRLVGTNTNPALLRLFLLVFFILMAAHIICCFWVLLGGIPEESEPSSQYIRSFYWTITTVTTIGYGDITPHGDRQTLFVILVELLGAAMYGLVIGNIANLLANIDVAKTQFKEKMDKIHAFMKYQNIPHSLQKKINDYYGYLWESRRGYD